MKILALLFLILVLAFPFNSHGKATCVSLFNKNMLPAHFISSNSYKKIKRMNGYSRLTIAKAEGFVVVTRPLREKLADLNNTYIEIYVVVVDTNSNFKSILGNNYNLFLERVSNQVSGVIWPVFKVSGNNSEVLSFLSNPYASKSVLYAGLNHPKRFIERELQSH